MAVSSSSLILPTISHDIHSESISYPYGLTPVRKPAYGDAYTLRWELSRCHGTGVPTRLGSLRDAEKVAGGRKRNGSEDIDGGQAILAGRTATRRSEAGCRGSK